MLSQIWKICSKFFAETSDVVDKPNADKLVIKNKEHGSIEFNEVSFTYPKRGESDSLPVLKNISFKIPAGKTLAIVGSSGSGKNYHFKITLQIL